MACRFALPLLFVSLLCSCATGEPIDPVYLAAYADDDGDDDGGTTPSGGSAAGGQGSGGVESAGGSGGEAPPATACGDGVVDVGEECDDGNALDGDGCTACVVDCAMGELKNPLTDHCYRLFAEAVTQPSAEANCQAWGGAPGLAHLASISDASENDFVAALVLVDTWIGADDFGGAFAWIDETLFAFENYQTGEPNHPGLEHCMFMDAAAKWHDHDCGDTRPAYLCERRGAGTF